MGLYPVMQILCETSLCIGVVTRPKAGNENLGLGNGAGFRIRYGRRLAGIINKKFLPGTVLLPQRHVQSFLPTAVLSAKPAILIP